jgi:hypothetical protein
VRLAGFFTGASRGEPGRRRLPRVAIAILVAGVVLFLLGPFLPDNQKCQGAPCDTASVIAPWAVLALGLVWVLALIWLIVALLRGRR